MNYELASGPFSQEVCEDLQDVCVCVNGVLSVCLHLEGSGPIWDKKKNGKERTLG